MLKTCLFCVVVVAWIALSQIGLAEDRAVVSSGFSGSTPGGRVARQFLGIPADANCIKITWQLTLQDEDATAAAAERNPRQYKLVARCGHTVPERPGAVEEAKESIEVSGTWRITRGTKSDPQAIVYELATDDPKRAAAFVKVGDDLLHLLDGERRAVIGNSGWSYALNRNGKEH
jgi:hypothetical protein